MKDSNEIPDYNLIHVKLAAEYVAISKAKVLVVGCNTGKDCMSFIKLGAPKVFGLDVVPNVGSDFQHSDIEYYQNSVEDMPFEDNTFDLVFCFATMEHVPDISSGFEEMARVTRQGGYVYSIAAPLWNSPYGHHKPDLFDGYPWMHLLYSRQEIIDFYLEKKLGPLTKEDLKIHVDYMLNPQFFNKHPSSAYYDACKKLNPFIVYRNGFDYLPEDSIKPNVESKLKVKGYSKKELLVVNHYFIAKKKSDNLFARFADRLMPLVVKIKSIKKLRS